MDNYKMEVKEQGSENEEVKQQEQSQEQTVNILNDSWIFWYRPRGKNVQYQNKDYTSVQHNLGQFSTLEDFFSIYSYLKRPSEIPNDHKICCFRKNTRPFWEDFEQGGSWILVFKKNDHQSINYCWEYLLFCLICEKFNDYNVIGLILSVRSKKKLIEIWIKDCQEEKKKRVQETLYHLLCTKPDQLELYFKDHKSCLAEANTLRDQGKILQTPYGDTPMLEPTHKGKDLFNQKDISELEEFDL